MSIVLRLRNPELICAFISITLALANLQKTMVFMKALYLQTGNETKKNHHPGPLKCPLRIHPNPWRVFNGPECLGHPYMAAKSPDPRTLEAVCTQGVSNDSEGWERQFM